MSITIITLNEYKTRYPDSALSGIRDARIQSAINLSFSYLDVKTGCAISSRWNIVSPTAGYLTEEQKGYVKEAMYVETQYIITNNLDFSQGADQTSFGNLSVSSSRPNRKEVCETALLYLQKAGLYDYLQFTNLSYAGGNQSVGTIDPTDVPISETTADLRYVHKNQGKSYAGKFLYVDTNGNVALTDAGLDPASYYIKSEIDAKLYPLQQMRDKLALGYLKSISRDTINKTITITTDDGYLTTFPYGGGTQIDQYLKSASVSPDHTTLYITDKDGNILTYNPTVATSVSDVKQNGTSVVDPTTKVADITCIEPLGNEAVSGQPYHFPYHLVMVPTADNIGITAYTITLDNLKSTIQYPFTLPSATQTTAGLINATTQTIGGSKTFTDPLIVDYNDTIIGLTGGGITIADVVGDETAGVLASGLIHIVDAGTASATQYTYDFPLKSGTLALVEDIPSITNCLKTDGSNNMTGTITTTNNVSLRKSDYSGKLSLLGSDSTSHGSWIDIYSIGVSHDSKVGGIEMRSMNTSKDSLLWLNPEGYITYGGRNVLVDKVYGGLNFSNTLTFTGGSSAMTLVSENNNSALNIAGGSSIANGGALRLYGFQEGSSNAGSFIVSAYTGGVIHELIGKGDGTLIWDDYNVITSKGGTMTGTINTDVVVALKRNSDSAELKIGTGDDADLAGCPNIRFYGNAFSGREGNIYIDANNGTNQKILVAKPDGTLTWGGNDISGTPTTYTISTGSGTNISVYRSQCYKIGRMVFVSISGKNNTEIAEYTSSTAIFTGLPAPVAQTDIGVFYFDRSSSRGTRFRLNTSGQIVTDSEGFEANYFTFNFSYISAS